MPPSTRRSRIEKAADLIVTLQLRIARARFYAWRVRLRRLRAKGYRVSRLPNCMRNLRL
jgi:hypothetical protein